MSTWIEKNKGHLELVGLIFTSLISLLALWQSHQAISISNKQEKRETSKSQPIFVISPKVVYEENKKFNFPYVYLINRGDKIRQISIDRTEHLEIGCWNGQRTAKLTIPMQGYFPVNYTGKFIDDTLLTLPAYDNFKKYIGMYFQ